MAESADNLPEPEPEPEIAGDESAPILSADLLEGRDEVRIQHGDEIYRLRITRNGKLILHK